MNKITALVCLVFLGCPVFAAEVTTDGDKNVLVRFEQNMTQAQIRAMLNPHLFRVERVLVPTLNLYLVRVNERVNAVRAVEGLKHQEGVVYAQPDHKVQRRSIPTDPDYPLQWNFHNPKEGKDINAEGAWTIGTGGQDNRGKDIVVAVVDGGMDLTHKDLVDNIWKNVNEIPGNGIDDDSNGFVDDVNGWNAYDHDAKIPVEEHGTHVGGIIGARGNNSVSVAGVNWNVKLMMVAASSATTSVVAEGYGYVIAQKKLWLETNGAKGANIVSTNSSFGVDFADCKGGNYPVWNDLYNEMGKYGILSAAATANWGIDVDKMGDVPTGCESDYLITVTNTDRRDNLFEEAGYGLKSIDLGAPGTDIVSTIPGDDIIEMTGTSMATPHIAGAVALLVSVGSADFNYMLEHKRTEAMLVVKGALLSTVEKISDLNGKSVSGGRLNLAKAVEFIHNFISPDSLRVDRWIRTMF